jgi:tight adherence protein C
VLSAFTDSPQTIVAFLAALSVFSAIVVVSWPYLARDELGSRMRQISSERERIRLRERAKLESQSKQASLRAEPKKLYKAIVDRFNLLKEGEDGPMVKKLRMAGFRGQNPVFVFLALRLMLPFVMFMVAALYVWVILKLEQPFAIKLGICLALAYSAITVRPFM